MSSNKPTYEDLVRRVQEQEQMLQEEKQMREKAEELSRPTSFQEALCLWHTLYSNPKIHYRPGKIYVSHFTSAINRLCPKSLQPWSDFNHCHRQAWNEIIQAVNSAENKLFDPKSTYEAEANRFMPGFVLHNEAHLVEYLGRTLEQQVTGITRRIGATMTFTDQDKNSLADITNRIEQMEVEDQPTTPPSNRRYDKVCSIVEAGSERPVLVVEYKAAHKLCPALLLDLEPARSFELEDIIQRHKVATQENERQRERAEEIMAVVITQTFDYMIDQGVSYGYVTGGQAFIFLHYDFSNPQTVYYHCETVRPDDYENIDNELFRTTAVGLVAGFARLAASCGQVKGPEWIKQTRETLSTWMVNHEAMVANFTPSPAPAAATSKGKGTMENSSPAFRGKGPATDGSDRVTRSKSKAKAIRCDEEQNPGWTAGRKDDDGSDKENDSTKEPKIQAQTSQKQVEPQGSSTSLGTQGHGTGNGPQNALFCTQACLLGLMRGGKLDGRCPNVRAHRPGMGNLRGQHHLIDKEAFQSLLEDQLGHVPRNEGFQSLDRGGWSGALFWVRLLSHGYTFVAKGTVDLLVPVLRKEARMYERMKAIQGKAVPVYLGSIDMSRPFYLCSGVLIVHLMLLSWGGEEVESCGFNGVRLEREIKRTVLDVKRLGVDQGDLRWPNVLWSKELRRVVLIDFEYGQVRETSKDGTGERALAEKDGNVESKRVQRGPAVA